MKKKLLILGLITALSLSVISCSGNTKKEEKKEDTKVTEAVAEVEKEDNSVSTEFKSALKKAKSYSDGMHMSKQGIYNQLTSEHGEKFPADAAQYAIDNLKSDFNKNALKKAESYSDGMYMAKQSIYDQLISEHGEKFTAEEAQYAIDNLKADYNKNALKKLNLIKKIWQCLNKQYMIS